MKLLQLVPVGDCDLRALEQLGPALAQRFHVAWDVLPQTVNTDKAFHAERQQYHSTDILSQLRSLVGPECWRVLGVTHSDLYIPILTFVFGEAQMGGSVAVVSDHRLHQEFYGLPGDEELLHQRLLKEAVHELGHTLELRHCEDYRCAMAGSHSVEWIDLKDPELCAGCLGKITLPEVSRKKRLWPF